MNCPARLHIFEGDLIMSKLMHTILSDDSGAAGVEYALLVSAVAVAIAGFMITLSTNVSTAFQKLQSAWP